MPKEDRTVIAVTTDLFLQSRITQIAKSLGMNAQFAADKTELFQKLSNKSVLVAFDLSTTEYDPFSLATDLKSRHPSIRILGFFPHIKVELKTKGEQSGVDIIVPNSKLTETLRKELEAQRSD